MAKQDGEIKITGTIQNITFYEVDGQFLARKKSSLTRKKFFRSPAFEGSRRSCKRLAEGSRLASQVYRTLPEVKRYYALYCELKSLGIRLLKEGKSEKDVLRLLGEELTKKQKVKKVRVKEEKKTMQPKLFTVLFVRQGVRFRLRRKMFMRLLKERVLLKDRLSIDAFKV